MMLKGITCEVRNNNIGFNLRCKRWWKRNDNIVNRNDYTRYWHCYYLILVLILVICLLLILSKLNANDKTC